MADDFLAGEKKTLLQVSVDKFGIPETKLQPTIEAIAIKNDFSIFSFPVLPKNKNSLTGSKNPKYTVFPRGKISVVSSGENTCPRQGFRSRYRWELSVLVFVQGE
jgi:hypothetical protein